MTADSHEDYGEDHIIFEIVDQILAKMFPVLEVS